MLTRIENAYLGILRIVVLVVATLALIVAMIAFVMSMPALARQFGIVPTAPPHGGTLGEYIEAKKATAPPASSRQPDGTAAAAEPPRSSNPDVQAAAKALQGYTKGAGGTTIPRWEQDIEGSAGPIPADLVPGYHRDVRSLAEQLGRSRGKRLTPDQVRELLLWNRTRFAADHAIKNQDRIAATSKAMFALYVASAAFILFIMVVFTFLFVKVERSLRLVRTVRAETANA